MANEIGWGEGACNNDIGWGVAQEYFSCSGVNPVEVNVNHVLQGSVESGTILDIDLTDGTNPVTPTSSSLVSNVLTIELPAAAAPVGATLMKTGQTTSYRTGDDGDLEAGRSTNFTTLASNNPFGNTNRFTSELGTQTYTNNIVIDWSTYDGSTVLGISRVAIATGQTWNNAIDNSLSYSVGTFTSGWRLANIKEIFNLLNYNNDQNNLLNYSPLNLSSTGRLYWSSTTIVGATTAVYGLNNVGMTAQYAKTSTTFMTYFPVRTFTVIGTTLT